MKIGILGSGSVGKTLGAGFLKHGHQALLGTRDPEKPEVQQWLRETAGAVAGTFEQAAQFGELVVIATLGRAAEEAISLAGPDNFAGKTVMDTTNPIADGAPVGGILPYFTGPNESLGERIQSLLPKAHIVKVFNSVGAVRVVNPTFQQALPPCSCAATTPSPKKQSAGSFVNSDGSPTIAEGSSLPAPSSLCVFSGASAASSTTNGTTPSAS
jgi:8-hydroxy-5-deazaflavin:NADPH oxidoreductase